MADKYFKCQHCGTLFQGRARKYCTRKCRDAAYYLRKKAVYMKVLEQLPPEKEHYIAFPTREDVGPVFKASKFKKIKLGEKYNGKHSD